MKKYGIQWHKKKVWEQFSRFIRVRDALRTTNGIDHCVCVSCGRVYPAFGLKCLQAGHLIAGRGNGILFEPIGCHGQCYNCNVTLKGNWHKYLERIDRLYGAGDMIVKYLSALASVPRKFTVPELEELRSMFKIWADTMLDTRTLLRGHDYVSYSLLFARCDLNDRSMLDVMRLHSNKAG